MGKTDQQHCASCESAVGPLRGTALAQSAGELSPGWRVVADHHLEKDFKFANFAEALAFTNRVGAIAEAANHHPDILLGWGKVRVTLWTHSVDGLTVDDFTLATSIDREG